MWITLFFTVIAFAKFEALDPELKNFNYPFEVSFQTVMLRNEKLKMAYMDVRPKTPNGETVVLLHGKNFSGSYWERTAKDLLDLNYRVIIPDQIGFGKSSKPESFPYSFHYFSKLTHDLLISLNIQSYSLVGHSMGGMLATRMALMYPGEVRKLILVNPIGLEDWKTKVPHKTVDELYQSELKSSEESIRNYQKESYFDGKWNESYEKGIEILVGWTKHREYPKVAWSSALTTDMIFLQPVLYEFKFLKMPTLLLLGTRDRTAVGKAWADPKIKEELGRYDLLGKDVVKMIPNGELVEFPGVGHLPQVEAYENYWQQLKKFLQK